MKSGNRVLTLIVPLCVLLLFQNCEQLEAPLPSSAKTGEVKLKANGGPYTGIGGGFSFNLYGPADSACAGARVSPLNSDLRILKSLSVDKEKDEYYFTDYCTNTVTVIAGDDLIFPRFSQRHIVYQGEVYDLAPEENEPTLEYTPILCTTRHSDENQWNLMDFIIFKDSRNDYLHMRNIHIKEKSRVVADYQMSLTEFDRTSEEIDALSYNGLHGIIIDLTTPTDLSVYAGVYSRYSWDGGPAGHVRQLDCYYNEELIDYFLANFSRGN